MVNENMVNASTIKYREWCLKQSVKQRKGKNESEDKSIEESRKIQNITERLIRRMNKTLGNYYGDKSFIELENSFFAMEDVLRITEAY